MLCKLVERHLRNCRGPRHNREEGSLFIFVYKREFPSPRQFLQVFEEFPLWYNGLARGWLFVEILMCILAYGWVEKSSFLLS